MGDCEPIMSPSTYSPKFRPHTTASIERRIAAPVSDPNDEYSRSSILLSWAVVQAHYQNNQDALFGILDLEDDDPCLRGKTPTGPSASILPLRIPVEEEATVSEFMQSLHGHIATTSKRTALSHIGEESVQTVLVIQKSRGKEEYFPIFSEALGGKANGILPLECSIMLLCQIDRDFLRLRVLFDDRVMTQPQMGNTLDQFTHVISQAQAKPQLLVKDLMVISPNGYEQLSRLNRKVPDFDNFCIHHIINEWCLEQPEAQAVASSDGGFTYREIGSISDDLASQLSQHGVMPETLVPICFEKSRWAIIAIIGVIKAGGAFVLLDPSYPLSRLQAICQEINSQIVICSNKLRILCSQLADTIVVDDTYLSKQGKSGRYEPSAVRPENPLYVAFTSGSTGKPKGVVIEHRAYRSGAKEHLKAFNIDCHSRVLQFVSYAFDVSIMEMLSTLMAGACLCILDEKERIDPSLFVQTIGILDISHAFLTPSFARTLPPDGLGKACTLILGGEQMLQSDAATFSSKHAHLMNAYGPAECSVNSTVQPLVVPGSDINSIGFPTGAVAWIVDQSDHENLMPIGFVGELLIEGPIVGRGYLNNDEATKAVFIDPPVWLQKIRKGDRQHRLYKTGDLAYQDGEGSLTIFGRKDGQVKIRGQRVDLGDVEYHMQQLFTTASDVVVEKVTASSDDDSILVAFVLPKSLNQMHTVADETMGALFAKPDNSFVSEVRSVRLQLQELLPNYMIPTVIIPLAYLPKTKSGKIDRKLLNTTASMSRAQLNSFNPSQGDKRLPLSDIEYTLRQLYAEALNLPLETIGMDDNFFHLGGDSIIAIRLVAAAREAGILMSVAEIYQKPTISEQATNVQMISDSPCPTLTFVPFSMLSSDATIREEIFQASQDQCRVAADQIEDVYPCTALQEGMFALSTRNPKMNTGRIIFQIPDEVDLLLFRSAWQATTEACPILRTRIIHTAQGFFQVVLRDVVDWEKETRHPKAHGAEHDDRVEHTMHLGQSLARFNIVTNCPTGTNRQLFLTLHHALCDGWSLQLVHDQLEAAYRGLQLQVQPFRPFIEYTESLTEGVEQFWRSEFEDLRAPIYPALPSGNYRPCPGATLRHTTNPLPPPQTAHTISNYVQLAWSILVARYTDVEEAVFGVTVSGRNAPVMGIEGFVGPTIATVPLRVPVHRGDSVSSALDQIQSKTAEMIPFEQAGLPRISRCSSNAARACSFQSHLIIQPPSASPTVRAFPVSQGTVSTGMDYTPFASYALVIICGLRANSTAIDLSMNYDPAIFGSTNAQRIAFQFETILQQLCQLPTETIGQVQTTSPQDMQQLSEWNAATPAPDDRCLHDLVLAQCTEQPEAVAISSWDGILTYRKLSVYSSTLTHHLVQLGLQRGAFVPICYEKSVWAIVSIIAVLRAGGVCVLLDPEHPRQRMEEIVLEATANLLIASPTTRSVVSGLCQTEVFVSQELMAKLSLQQPCHRADGSEGTYSQKARLWSNLIISSEQANKRKSLLRGAKRWLNRILALSLEHQPPCHSTTNVQLEVQPDDLAFVIFTSGSTGTPKGIMMPHRSLSTSIRDHRTGMNLKRHSRTLHFSSYSFDVSIYEIFTTLAAGGCVCVPSHDDRMNDLAGFIRRYSVNWAFMTPSTINILRPDEVPSLETLVLGGEPVTHHNVEVWGSNCSLITGYGPAEATICAVGRIPEKSWKFGDIGRTVGCIGWITLPSDPSQLAPIGAVGELLLEGPVLAQGYLHNPENTAKVFIDGPSWRGHFPSRLTPRLYRTGDLVEYQDDGSIRYIGRKDTQIKLRGQRIELGGVEKNVLSIFPAAKEVISEVVTLEALNHVPTLVSFVHQKNANQQKGEKDAQSGIFAQPNQEFLRSAALVQAELTRIVPQYMVPSILIPLAQIPRTVTGKTDRRSIQESVAALSTEEIQGYRILPRETKPVATISERQLQTIWGEILGLPLEKIGADDSFFLLGGDSIGAMKMAAMARDISLPLSVRDILTTPELSSLASLGEKLSSDCQMVVAPEVFHSDKNTIEITEPEKALISRLKHDGTVPPQHKILKVRPATQVQKFLISRYPWTHFSFSFKGNISVDRLQNACAAVTAIHSILRTLFINYEGNLMQVVLDTIEDTFQHIIIEQDLKSFCHSFSTAEQKQSVSDIGQPTRFTLVSNAFADEHTLIIRLTHAQYDGICIPRLFQDLETGYNQESNAIIPPTDFCHYLDYRDLHESRKDYDFWGDFLKDSSVTTLDIQSTPGPRMEVKNLPDSLVRVSKTVAVPRLPPNITLATLVKAASSIAIAQLTHRTDLVFGQTVNGRSLPLPQVDQIVGPCVNYIPFRMKIQPRWTVLDFLHYTQTQHARCMSHESVELNNIIQKCTDWADATGFGFIVQHQNIERDLELCLEGNQSSFSSLGQLYPDEVWISSTPYPSNLDLEVSAPGHIMTEEGAGALVESLCKIVEELSISVEKSLGSFDGLQW